MNSKRLFEKIDYDNDSEWVMKEFFNSLYTQGKFLWALPHILKKSGCGVNETYCVFPDFDDPDPEYHFDGITFGVWEGEIIVPESVGFDYVKLACDKYLQLHPEDKDKINALLDQLPC
ncbi:ribonuclease toxin immunity protein CdiI [Xenorhabdus bovienii]|uniref:ribonuclease toxin immunity protein CdiI n=1 Tax=Xenorhabdus bovienii TaxID=40576 RepID=UPI00237CF702|nr:ribonuclease toxin immunity protein CdiI [Xenorhabdus bovienii]MDE1483439.1 ribonuclease toxin immunity protein CdiI [Xenorhabdus bovienii]MDE9428175.1 ribonuclease toxin immunity protein CdiI [Xenorhabdus bovienii]MDE9431970.1 ribonuclease toxin immunity protein CdiI [Xenorhabdus bovienii]MDE9458857.1 ribonuclease toxin immunity protein CdiI [Xenorhabdus bovienii]MDE9460201.1 ribonuclease toxin immunity protein CdiI [Xenorhabdus bovienii]